METHPAPSASKTITPFARAMRNAGYLLGGSGVGAVFGFLTTILAVRQLGLRDYGLLLLIYSFTGALSAGTRLQTWQPILQFGTAMHEALDRARLQTLLRHCLLLDMAGAGAAVIIGAPLMVLCSRWLGWGGYEKAAILFVTCALFMNTNSALGVMRLTDRYKMAAIADNAAALIRLAGSAVGILLHWKLTTFLTIWYLSIVTAFTMDALLLWWLTKLIPSLQGFRLIGVAWYSREPGFWKLLLPTSIDQALIGLIPRVDLLIIGSLLGSVDVSLYRVATQLGEALIQPAAVLAPALYPEFVRMREQQDWQALRKTVWRLCRWLTLFSVIVLGLIFFFGPEILSLLLGKHISGSRELLLWITGTGVVDLWNVPLEPLLISLGYAKTLLHRRLWVLVLCLPLLYGLTLTSGVNGAAIAIFIRRGIISATRFSIFLRIS